MKFGQERSGRVKSQMRIMKGQAGWNKGQIYKSRKVREVKDEVQHGSGRVKWSPVQMREGRSRCVMVRSIEVTPSVISTWWPRNGLLGRPLLLWHFPHPTLLSSLLLLHSYSPFLLFPIIIYSYSALQSFPLFLLWHSLTLLYLLSSFILLPIYLILLYLFSILSFFLHLSYSLLTNTLPSFTHQFITI